MVGEGWRGGGEEEVKKDELHISLMTLYLRMEG